MRRVWGSVTIAVLVLAGCGPEKSPEDEPRNPPREPELPLRGGGIGPSDFGDAAEAVLAELEEELGEPDADTGLVPVASGTCEGTRVRAVDWGGLRLGFTDGETQYESVGVEHLFTWDYGGGRGLEPELATEQGLQLGEPEQDLVARYGSAASVIPANDGQPAVYQIDIGEDVPIEVILGADELVTQIRGGTPCREESTGADSTA